MNKQPASPQSIRCKARTKTGKQCKKMSVRGYDFCRIHGFGKIKGTPWYENGIFLTAVSLVVGFLIAYFFFLKGPSQESQNELLAKQDKSISKQDDTLKVATNLPLQMNDLKGALEKAEREQAMSGKLDRESNQPRFPIISCGGARFCQFDPSGTIFCDNGEPLVAINRDREGRILLSAKIRNEKGELIAEIRDNEWKLNPDLLFDRNYTNFAVEVRERTGNVVLQVADLGDVIHFEGILRCRNGRMLTIARYDDGTKQGAAFTFTPNTASSNARRISEIFEYPSALHLGSCPGYEGLRKIEPLIEPGKPLGYIITKPLEICNIGK
jgi:hypothetical protein